MQRVIRAFRTLLILSSLFFAPTRDAAEIAHVNSGLVATGKSADFIVLHANLLENISSTRQISKVFLRGQDVDCAALRAKWLAAANQARENGRR